MISNYFRRVRAHPFDLYFLNSVSNSVIVDKKIKSQALYTKRCTGRERLIRTRLIRSST